MDPWKTLIDAGLPDGAARPVDKGPLEDQLIARAIHELASRVADLTERERDPLAAWLSAFSHHWPSRFRDVFGEEGQALLQRVQPTDPNRYLKLRRIAIENLAARL